MKKTMKKCLTLLLALAMLLAMAVPAAAEEPNYSRTITFTNVAQGDTVKAYKLGWYDENYNKYIFHDGFIAFLQLQQPKKLPEDVLKNTTKEGLTAMIANYVLMDGHSLAGVTITLPSDPVEMVAGTDNKVQMTLEPGYYLLLVSTTEQNNRTYMPVTVFVQVKNGNVKVYAAGSELADDLTAVFKHEEGPAINVRVNDDSRGIDERKETAGGRVGETMDFYMEVSTPAYTDNTFNITKLTANCQLAGLNYVADSMKATTLPNAGSDAVEGAIKGTTVGADGNLTVELNYSKIRSATGRGLIYLHFKAKVMPEAAAAGKTATAETKLDYTFSLDPTTSRTTSAVGVKVHTYAFSLAKLSDEQNAAGANLPLTNAGFTLYSDNTMTTPIKMVKVDATATTDAYYRPALTGETDIVTEMAANMGADQNTLLVRGLDAATYYLKETKVPAGYYAPKGGFAVQLTGEREAVNETLNGKLAAASSFTATNATDNVLLNGTASVNGTEMNRLDASLKNSSTPVLPTTGGVGTVMFTVIGLLCMGAALWFFLFARRRREDEQEQNKTTL